MSAQTEPSPLRTPTEHRADTLLLLLRGGFVDRSRRLGAMRLLGLTLDDMTAASRRTAWTVGFEPTPPLPAPEFVPEKPRKAATRVRPTRRTPDRETVLHCSLCKQWKPLDAFTVRSDRPYTGTRRPECKDCGKARSRQRYLNVTARESLGTVGLDFIVEEGDASAKLVCVRCQKAIEPGQEATVSGEVGHVVCPGAA